MDELPEDWRARMVQLVSGQVPADGALFAGGPAVTPEQRIGLYRTQYRLRLVEAVEDDLLGLRRLAGDERVRRWIEAYLMTNPSTSWTLDRLSHRFAAWLASQEDASVSAVEMAQLDHAVQRGFSAGDGVALSADDLASVPALALAPHVTLLRHTTTVYAVRSALLVGESVPALEDADVRLVLHRRDRRMRHWRMDAGPFAVLEAIGAGEGVMDAVSAGVEAGGVEADQVGGAVASWFQSFAEEGLLVRG